ncbi:carboxypeptidase-like regulatory domain-containing protein [Flavobacterium sp. ASW18X]|uniref:carboxypeptidase-like regulatory domain-containing protein n=1 Tax=Flavobacterium sp. ASW18X TaxID=2572595 RepID=UPI0010AEE216|nr:carboxypeptidase-like regulatory domain-containing protein [Flavobacterium sp. ASW18X]TKD62381.1 carboxypeptidase-like regulatory domain-containing protein [Flavobacterium sp. ASW18X]
MKKIFTLILFAVCCTTTHSVVAQNGQFREYNGEVLEEGSNKSLALATISIENTNISTITNTDGEFSLKVPLTTKNAQVIIAFLGYETKSIPLTTLNQKNNKIHLKVAVTALEPVNINAPKDAEKLVREVLSKKGEHYLDAPSIMTAFYRETIKKRRRNVSLSEAVVNIYKSPYASDKNDAMRLYKARKSTDYNKLDTVALKLQGGPFNTLYVDLMKYPEYIFAGGLVDEYRFKYEGSTLIDDRQIYVIAFNQLESIADPLYKGKLYIDVENKTLVSAVYQLNITDREKASRLFVRRKPAQVDVWPTEVAYRVDYREKNGKWYYGYSNILMEFKVNWEGKLFNSLYSMAAEMAVTDWKQNTEQQNLKNKEKLKRSTILADEAIGFSDPDFWGEYNIIEPEKSIESAIKKIQRQIKRANKNGAAKP